MKSTAILAFLAAATFGISTAQAGDAANGEQIFKKCMACHQIGPDAKNGVGPDLTGVIGRAAGAAADYKYGKHIVEAGEAGLIWTEEEIFAYLADPRKYLRARLNNKKAKSKMSFKLKKEAERNDVIAYLATFSPTESDATQ